MHLLGEQLRNHSPSSFLVSTHAAQKLKQMQTALDICLQCQLIFGHVIDTNSSVNIDDDEFKAHLSLYESRLQNALKTLIKLLLTTGKDPKQLSALYKRMYIETLTGKHGIGAQQTETAAILRAQHLHTLLTRLKAMCGAQPSSD